MAIILYQLDGCPYCDLVTEKLEALSVDFESVWVDGHHSKRTDVKRITGQRQVPALIDEEHGVTMSQSRRILEYLGVTYGDADSISAVDRGGDESR